MLELKNIKKDYPIGGGVVHALKGINLRFRKSEFVAILGQSGCGKTTMLNIIGGLDQYSDGDLIVNGTSTKNYKDKDWDTYRNHSCGFVFQSYNLIPHQSVLQNVELALTLSGVSKKERKERAIKALAEVGLSTQLHKKPSEMSGGQMQRVAIARALVNNPDIILADEPTGALDSETSVQVMEILKEVSKERLVIMVTHNPELAETYATRTIRMLDGVIISDSMPVEEEIQYEVVKSKKKKPSMSMTTSFGLSMKNLFTKKGRTILTAFAGSIGIIGIALIFSISNGLNNYINKVQEDTLSSYPLMIEETHMDVGTLLQTFAGTAENAKTHEKDAIYSESVLYDMMNALNNMEASENDLKSFKAYLEKHRYQKDEKDSLGSAINGIHYGYDLDLLVYTKNVDGKIIYSDASKILQELIQEMFGSDMSSMIEMSENNSSNMMSMMTSGNDGVKLWQELLPGDKDEVINPLLKKQYDVVYGDWPKAWNEVVLVLNERNELSDMALYALGVKSKDDIDQTMNAVLHGSEINIETNRWTYEEICNREYRVLLNSDCYKYDEATDTYTDLRNTDAGVRYLYDKGMDLKVVGVIRPNEEAVSAMLTGSIAYTNLLSEKVIEQSKSSDVLKAQQDQPTIDIFSGLPFQENSGNLSDKEKQEALKKHIEALNERGQAELYVAMKSIPDSEYVDAQVDAALGQMTREQIETSLLGGMSSEMKMSEEEVKAYLEEMSDEELNEIIELMLREQIKVQYAQGVQAQMAMVGDAQKVQLLNQELNEFDEAQCVLYYDEVLEFSDSSYDANLKKLGSIDLDKPSMINIYASTFESKDIIEDAIAEYNKGVEELQKIQYTDYVGIMMSSITSIINAITYVLIAFVAISLIVSSIMIGVITLISVQERTKEIGILRAIGASKKDVSGMFNAETVIIGLVSGILGVGVTYLLCIPINAIVQEVTGIAGLKAYLPIEVAILLTLISIILTLFAGIIPSRSAAKKDPVVALRTE